MPTSFSFAGQAGIIIPGVYSTISSGVSNPSVSLQFGNTLLINTGSGKFFGGGSGINGTLKQGKDSIYTFDNVRDFRNFVKGGLHWFLSAPLFNPGAGATAGVSSLTYVSASTTVPAEILLEFGDFASDTSNNGSCTLQCRDEGYIGNAVLGDETRAKSTITITNAGTNGNVISIQFDGETLGTYTVQTGNTIPQVVAGLAASITSIGLGSVFSTSNTQIVIYAPSGYATAANGVTTTINKTGTVNGTAGAFSGGVEGTILTRGYAAKISAGVIDTSKFIVNFYRGTFKGLDTAISNGDPFDNVAELDCKPTLILKSPEVSTVQELVTWMQDTKGKGYLFNQYFYLSSYTIATVDEIVSEDITGNYVKASGGTESYGTDDLTDVLEALEGNYDFILADKWGSNALSTSNLSILDWITNTAKIKPDMYVASGSTAGEFSTSNTVAQTYDSQYVSVVHGGILKTDLGGQSFKEYDSIVKAAYLLGREAGLAPQIPLTFKGIGINGELHQLKKKDIEQGLESGLLMTRLDDGSYECIKGVNSLQNNDFLVNADGSTSSKQLGRIVRQLNKEITINAKRDLLKKPNGVNRNTLSAADVKTWLEGYLSSKIATPQDDDIIISFRGIDVVRNQDAYYMTYIFEGNTEISFLFATGVLVDLNS